MMTLRWLNIWTLVLVFVTCCYGFGRKGDLWLIGKSRVTAEAGTTVHGICNVTSPEIVHKDNFNVNNLVIKDHRGNVIPRDLTQPISPTAVNFTIKEIQKQQFGKYHCYYMNGADYIRIRSQWIYVGVKPMKPNLTEDAVQVYNWENMTITASPSIEQQNVYTHHPNETDVWLATKCQIWYNFRCGPNVEYKKCAGMDGDRQTTTCKVPSDDYNDLGSPQSPNYCCIKVEFWNKAFGNSSAVFRVDLAQRVKPAPVPDLHISHPNSSTPLRVWWAKANTTHEILYTLKFSAQNFLHQVTFANITKNEQYVTNLIPHGDYNVQVTVRPKYAGLESDARATTVIMPPDVPAENPQLIGVGLNKLGGDRWMVSLYWKRIPEIKRNGDLAIRFRICEKGENCSLKHGYDLPGDQTSYVTSEASSDDTLQLEAVTINDNLGTNHSLPKVEVAVSEWSRVAVPFLHVEAQKDYNKTSISVTWDIPPDAVHHPYVTIVYCDKEKERRCDNMIPLKVVTLAASRRFARVNQSDIYKIGLINSEGGRPGLITWSPCIYQQGEVPSLAPHISLKPEPNKVNLKVKAYLCGETRARVSRVEGSLCRTSDKKTCSGEKRLINISDSEFEVPHTYDIKSPGSHYMVKVQAVSEAGRSPERMEVVLVSAAGGVDVKTIVTSIAVTFGVLIIIVFVAVGVRKYRAVKNNSIPIRIPPTPPAQLLPMEESETYEEPQDVVPSRNSYARLVLLNINQKSSPDDVTASSSAESGGNGVVVFPVPQPPSECEESDRYDDYETEGTSAISTDDNSGLYAIGAVRPTALEHIKKLKQTEIPMSVFKNEWNDSDAVTSTGPVMTTSVNSSASSAPVARDKRSTGVGSSSSDVPAESVDAVSESRGTRKDSETTSAGSSRTYAQITTRADQDESQGLSPDQVPISPSTPSPPPSPSVHTRLLPPLRDELAVDFQPEVEEQKYVPAGTKGSCS